jgi:polysaccharide pyruvyl transferase WcaK-like protein
VETVITIANWAGVNSGDDAIFSSLLSALRAAIPGKLTIYVLSDNEKEIARKYQVDGTAPLFEYYRPNVLPTVLRFLKRSDLVIFGGGDLLNGDLTSLSFLKLAKKLGVPVMCCGVGVLPIKNRVVRMLARDTLNSLDLITVRDPDSIGWLVSMGVREVPIHLTADLAFLLLPKLHGNPMNRLKSHNGGSLSIGLNIRAQDPMYRFYSEWNDERFMDTLAVTCNQLIDEMDAHILFLPMEVCGRGKEYHHHVFDDDIATRLKRRIERSERFSVMDGEFAPDDLKGFMGELDLLLAMRLHSLLIASDQGVPLVAFDYAPKIRSFMVSIGREDYLLPIEGLESRCISDMVKRALADDRWSEHKEVDELYFRSKRNISMILGLLEERRKSTSRFFVNLSTVPFFIASNYLLDIGRSVLRFIKDDPSLEL